MSGTRIAAYQAALVFGAALLFAGCRGVAGEYVWADTYSGTMASTNAEYLISRGDLISVRVWNQESMSARARVRSDGMVSLPFVNDVVAAGLQPTVLAKNLQVKLKEFIVAPVVTVAIEEPAPVEVSVLGEVARPGVFRLDNDAGVLKALAIAGGLTPVAGRDRIFVLREDAAGATRVPVRIRFTYEALGRGNGAAARFRLRSGDVVLVE